MIYLRHRHNYKFASARRFYSGTLDHGEKASERSKTLRRDHYERSHEKLAYSPLMNKLREKYGEEFSENIRNMVRI